MTINGNIWKKRGSNCNISTRCWIGARTSGNLIKLADEPFDGTPSVNTLDKVIDFMTNDSLESIQVLNHRMSDIEVHEYEHERSNV